MIDPTAPINDGVDGWMALCDSGTTLDGAHCTGIAYINHQFIRCSDPVHEDLVIRR